MNKIIKNLIIFFSFFLIAFFSFRLLTNGIIGLRHDWVLPIFSDQINTYLSNELWMWSDLFGYPFSRRNLLFFKIFLGFIANIVGYNPILFSTLSVISLMSLSGFFMFLFAKRISLNEIGGMIAGLFYMLSPVVFNTFTAGYTAFIFSYALAPLIFLLFYEGINDSKIKWVHIIFASLLFGFSFAHQQFIFFIPSIILLWIFLKNIKEKKINFGQIKAFFLFIFIGLVMHLFWILPSFLAANTNLNRLGAIGYHALQNSPDIWQLIIMVGWSHEYDYSNLLLNDKIPFIIIFLIYIIISLSISSLLFKNNRWKKIFFTILFLIGIFFGTGLNNPGRDFYQFIYTNVSIFRVFRDPYYFSFFISLSVSILLSFLVNDLFNLVKRTFQRQKIVKSTITCSMIVLIFFSSLPILTGDFSDQIQSMNLPAEYETVNQYISEDTDICRVLYLPSFQPMKISGNIYAGVDPMIRFSPKSTFPQHVDTTNRLNRFHEYTILSLRNAEDIENFVNVTSTKYIVERENFESWYWKYVPGDIGAWKKNNYTNNSLPGELTFSTKNISLYTRNYSNFFRINTPIIGFGNLNLINNLPNNAINNFSIIFHTDIYDQFDDFSSYPYITNDVNGFENAIVLLNNPQNIIRFQTEILRPNDGWSYDVNTWRQNKIITADQFINGINSVQTSKINAKISKNFIVDKENNYYLFLRYFKNNNGGLIKIYIDDEEIILNTKDKLNYFDNEIIGLFNLDKGNHEITIENIEGFNSISYISYFSSDEYSKYKSDFHKNISNQDLIYFYDVKNHFYKLNDPKNDDESSYHALNLELIGEAWREIRIDKTDNFFIGVKGKGEFDIFVNSLMNEFNSDKFSYQYFGPFQLSEGRHNISIKSYKTSGILDESFEEDLSNWSDGSNAFIQELSKDSYKGEYSLQLTTDSNKTHTWSWLRSDSIDVEPGITCRIFNHLKYENVKQSHIAIEGYNISSKRWQQLIQLPSGKDGSSKWKEYDILLKIPDNFYKLRTVLNAGWVLNESNGSAKTWFDEISIFPYTKGYIDDICLFPTSIGNNLNDFFTNENKNQILNCKKISPTSYELKINSTEPFMLSFSESFNEQWIAQVNNKGKISNYNPIPLYGTINGYWINETGTLEIKINYTPQQWLDFGLIISLSFILICFLYIIYVSKNNIMNLLGILKNDKKKNN